MELQTEGTGRSPEMKETPMHMAASEEVRVVSQHVEDSDMGRNEEDR